MIDFDTDSSIEKREEVLREIKETEDHPKTSDFVSLVHPTDIFDIIVGTSTGSLISFGLVGGNRQRDEVIEERLPMSLEQCLEMYKKNVAIIFSRNYMPLPSSNSLQSFKQIKKKTPEILHFHFFIVLQYCVCDVIFN